MGNRGRSPRAFVPFVWSLIVALVVLFSIPAIADEGKDESGKGGKEQHEKSGEDEGSGNGNEGGGNGGPGNGNQGNEESSGKDDGKDGGGGGEGGGSSSNDGSREKQRSDTSDQTSSGGGGRTSARSTSSNQQPTDTSTGQGNIPCTDVLGSGARELKLQNPSSGTYSDGTLSVTLTRTGEGTFTWSSNIDLGAVISKGGETSNIYRLPGSNDLSGSATTPRNPSNNQFYGLSHVSFCYGLTGPPSTGTPPPTPCVDNPNTPEDECNPTTPCVDNPNTPEDECNPTTPCVDNPTTPMDECNPPPGPCVDNPNTPMNECKPRPPGPPPGPPEVDDDDDVLGDILGNPPGDEVEAQGEGVETRPPGSGALPATGASVFTLIVVALTMIGTGVGAVVTRRKRI